MAWKKSEYTVTDRITYTIPDRVVRDCLNGCGWGNKIAAIKKLRDLSLSDGPFGIPICIGLRDAKEIIEDYIDNNSEKCSD